MAQAHAAITALVGRGVVCSPRTVIDESCPGDDLLGGMAASAEARDGREALRLCEREPVPVDLLVTDVVMPAMLDLGLAFLQKPLTPDSLLR